MNQVVANAGSVTLTKTWYQSGTPTDVDEVTIGIVDGNGTTVVAAGTATTDNNNGTYTYTLADQTTPTILIATWTDTSTGDTRVDRLEVVGNLLFTENQARTFAAKADATTTLIPLASSTEYPDATISDERARLTDEFERWTGRSWIPRYARVELAGSGSYGLALDGGNCRTSDGEYLSRPGRTMDISTVISASVGGTSVSTANIVVEGDVLYRTDGVWTKPSITDPLNVTLEYVYGLPYLADGVDRMALKLLLDRLVPSAFPERATRAETDWGSTSFIQPGGPMNNMTRIPEVNEWLANHNYKMMVW